MSELRCYECGKKFDFVDEQCPRCGSENAEEIYECWSRWADREYKDLDLEDDYSEDSSA